MFDSEELAGMTTRQLLDATAGNRARVAEAACETLLLAAAFADNQDGDHTGEWQPRSERPTIEGGRRGPAIDEDAAAEFGACLGVGLVSARNLISDAVALRYRMPLLWARVREASVPAWQARKLASGCAALDFHQAGEVDDRLAPLVGLVAWPRLERLLEAAVLEVDADAVAARAERAANDRFVRVRDDIDGLKMMFIRAGCGEIAWLDGAVQRIAEILGAEGDTDSLDVRRARAAGVLANPAAALTLLAAHVEDQPACEEPSPVEQVETDAGGEFVPPTPDPAGEAECAHVSLSVRSRPGQIAAPPAPPRAVLYFHLSEAALDPEFGTDPIDGSPAVPGLVRPEHGRPLGLGQLKEFLADTGCRVTIRPVVTPALEAPVDGYEIPERLRRAARLRHVVEPFPYSSCDRAQMDVDHTASWRPDGPSGQTGPANLAPLSRTSYRMATPRLRRGGRLTGRWRKRQPVPGTLVWQSPHGRIFLTTGHGALDLGDGRYARSVWEASRPAPAQVA